MNHSKLLSVLRLAVVSMALVVATALQAQTVNVKGVVTEAATGETVIGASISEVGTTNGTITDFDGNFSLQVHSGAQLEISYVGFKTVTVAATPNMTIALEEDKAILEEVVVIGYGTVKKNDATGSVTAIKPDDMNKGLNTNAQDMLSGKIAGVAVTSDGGTPGGSSTIRIRGGSSLNASNNPLIVIDGLAMDNNGIKGAANALSMINPADIETFTVLKDASATAIYGSRASNGVIIITTKKGAMGSKPKFSYEGNVSMGNITKMIETFSGDELRAYAAANPRYNSESRMEKMGNYNTNWQNYIYRPAISTDHNFSVMGGTKNMPYRASIGYTLNNGTIHTSQMQRVTAAINLNPTFLDKHLTFNLNAKGMYIYNRYADGGVVGSALSMDPTQPVYGGSRTRYYDGAGVSPITGQPYHEIEADIIETWFDNYYQRISTTKATYKDNNWPYTFNSQTTKNPVARLRGQDNHANSGAFVGNLEVDYKIHGFEDLRLHANFGADYSYGKQDETSSRHISESFYWGYNKTQEEKKYNLQFNAYAQYYKDFNENHHFDAMLGYEWQHFHRKGSWEEWGTYPENSLVVDEEGNSLAGTIYEPNHKLGDYETESYLVSFFGRVNYIALNRYMITATVRGDGSSHFKKGHRWGVFPSVALGWKIKEEAFLKDVYWLSDLKLRLGYGITGQQEITDSDYPYVTLYGVSKPHAYYPVGGESNVLKDENGNVVVDGDGNPVYLSYRPGALSEDLTWEKTTTYNAGLDFGFLKGRITGSFDYYYRKTTDLINKVTVPVGANFADEVLKNIGSLVNQGVEVSLNAVLIDKPSRPSKFKWDMGVNFTWNENRIKSLNLGEGVSYVPTGDVSRLGGKVQAHKEGYAAYTFRIYETRKMADGQGKEHYYIVDYNKDGKISDDDRKMDNKITPTAPYTIGFQTKWQFYNFDLSMSFHANIGNYVYNDVLARSLDGVAPDKLYSTQNGGYSGILKDAYKAYHEDGFYPANVYQLVWNKDAIDPITGNKGVYEQKTATYDDYHYADYFVEKASFLRCDNITLGYTFDKNDKVKARIYATVQNPFVITKYSGLDPEHYGGIDNNMYPRCMTSLLGLSLQF